MRNEFEKLPEIAEILKQKDIEYADYYGGKIYMSDCGPHGYLNGAWYAYQEQQKIINGALDLACKHQYSDGERIYNEIKELLK